MEPEELIAQIRVAFAAVARPSSDNIVNHKCDECDELRDGLLGFPSAELPDTWFDSNWDQLPLLSAQALQYYCPAYLGFALRQPDSLAAEFVLYALNSESPKTATPKPSDRRSVTSSPFSAFVCLWATSSSTTLNGPNSVGGFRPNLIVPAD